MNAPAGSPGDPRERLLEYALERHFADEREPDLAPRIVAAWERGLQGADLGELESPQNGSPYPTPVPAPAAWPRLAPRRFARRQVAWLAAGLVPPLLGLAAWLLYDPVPEPRLLARAELPFTVLRGEAVEAVPTVELRSGDFLVVDRAATGLVLEGGGRLAAEPGTLLLLREAATGLGLELVRGALVLEQAPAGLTLRSPLATLLPEPGASLVARLASEDAAAPDATSALLDGGAAQLARDHLADEPTPPLLFEVALKAGRAELRSAAPPPEGAPDKPLALAAGEQRLLSGGRAGGVARVLDESGRLELLLTGEATSWEEDARTRLGYLEPPARPQRLAAFLTERPRRWSLARPAFARVLADAKVPKLWKTALLDLTITSPAPQAFATARELWLAAPESFRAFHVVALAERGAFEFERETRALVAGLEPRDPELVLPAVYLAERGEESGVEALRALLVEPLRLEPALRLLAAAALERAGVPEPWAAAREAAAELLRSRLRGFDPGGAARIGLEASFFEAQRRAAGTLDLGTLPERLEAYRAEREPELEGTEAILRLLDEF